MSGQRELSQLHQGGILKEVAVLFECPAINAEELGQGIENDQRISTFWISHHLGSEVHGSDGTSLPQDSWKEWLSRVNPGKIEYYQGKKEIEGITDHSMIGKAQPW